MWKIVTLLLLAACGPVDQTNVRTVAAIEVMLREESNRADLLAILRKHAVKAGDLHVDDVSAKWRAFEDSSRLPRDMHSTFYVGVWRGADDDEAFAHASDRSHIGRVWLTFPRGAQPERHRRFREPLIAEIRSRWPHARPVPIMPTGALPHAHDLVWTPRGYRVLRAKAGGYGLPPSSPLLVGS